MFNSWKRKVASADEMRNDNRITLVQLTEVGKSKVAAFKAEKDRFMEELQADLTESERLALVHALQKLNSQIQRMKHPKQNRLTYRD